MVVLVCLHKGPRSVKKIVNTSPENLCISWFPGNHSQEIFVHLLSLNHHRRAELNNPFWDFFPECPWIAEKCSGWKKLNIYKTTAMDCLPFLHIFPIHFLNHYPVIYVGGDTYFRKVNWGHLIEEISNCLAVLMLYIIVTSLEKRWSSNMHIFIGREDISSFFRWAGSTEKKCQLSDTLVHQQI